MSNPGRRVGSDKIALVAMREHAYELGISALTYDEASSACEIVPKSPSSLLQAVPLTTTVWTTLR